MPIRPNPWRFVVFRYIPLHSVRFRHNPAHFVIFRYRSGSFRAFSLVSCVLAMIQQLYLSKSVRSSSDIAALLYLIREITQHSVLFRHISCLFRTISSRTDGYKHHISTQSVPIGPNPQQSVAFRYRYVRFRCVSYNFVLSSSDMTLYPFQIG
jgi:hypothetical protein